MALDDKITKVFTAHPEGDMNVRAEFHGNPAKSCWDISLETTGINLMVALEEVSEDHQRHKSSFSGEHVGIIFMEVHPVVVQIFQSGQKILPFRAMLQLKNSWDKLLKTNLCSLYLLKQYYFGAVFLLGILKMKWWFWG